MGKWFTYKQEESPERNFQRLRFYLHKASQSTLMLLENWLGSEVKVTGAADAHSLRFIMTFEHERLGKLGQVDLVFKGGRAAPAGVSARVCTGNWDSPDEQEDVDARKAMIGRIYEKARSLFILRLRWHISYYSGGEPLHSWVMIDDDIARVKSIACRESPPGTDMIKLVTPRGQTLIRTEKKQWAREG
jgi:hypothetical protein